VRCFLAIPLRPPALDTAQRILARLREDVPAVRWARPETLHLTVHFFGAIDDGRVAAALRAVEPAVAGARPFEVSVGRLGAFPERGWPRVLWLGSTNESAELTAFAADARELLRGAGFPVDERPFRAHATLGRPRVPWPAGARDAWRAAVSGGVPESRFTADRTVLFESKTGREAAVYLERATLPFGGG
jgi:2'-5' RNA ligase